MRIREARFSQTLFNIGIGPGFIKPMTKLVKYIMKRAWAPTGRNGCSNQ
jgi:hypothetical protein